ncbi:hypothetical protein [Paraburkholderia sp. DHOC27]|uniref:hypothetical protein n=1 Tax=Paraburkholderia sp. DHOC27 TaxID=2303330 RepID=UPI000E3E79AE|nr:hypothetical protein [Paraburkholderia sp. DHOC27]RFU44619.1 hypothetical protein D0B32_26320 [Paraburkholderia sp. DHOC27]
MNTKMLATALRLALCVGACSMLGACLSSSPTWDKTFGSAVTQITVMQTLNPNASDNDNPVSGVDGPAAQSAQANYDKSFKTPTPPANMFTIGVSAGSASN